jgi:hypothetical protein
MSDARAVHKDVDAALLRDCRAGRFDAGEIAYIASGARGLAAGVSDLFCGRGGRHSINIENVYGCAVCSEEIGDSLADTAAAAGDDRVFAIEAKTGGNGILFAQRETPLFQGMKSS